jgi:hypothetical protein
MRRPILATASLLCAALIGGSVAIYIAHHPFVTSTDLGPNTVDAKTSFHLCRLYASWPVELKAGEPLVVERRVCPVGFHKTEDDEGWISPVHHEVLLLESRRLWRTKIVSARFSDLDFAVDIGKTEEGRDAVLWSYFIKCGSCHGGPNGVLAWSGKSDAYLWNEKWFDSFSALAQAKLPADDYPDSPAQLTWESDGRELGYAAAVYRPGDPQCCPNGGRVVADFVVKDGSLALKDGFTFLASR